MVTRRQAAFGFLAGAALAAAPGLSASLEQRRLELPAPRREGGLALTAALQRRHSTREYSERALPAQVLSDLLWAAFGINRPTADRTAPYWRHVMVLDVYVAMADGVWIYDASANALAPHMQADIRAQTGLQDFVATAPVNLIYVAHGERMHEVKPEERRLYASVDAGFIGQNVYLFCASEGLATVFRAGLDAAKLARTLLLPEEQFVTFAQTVGYPRDQSSGAQGSGGRSRVLGRRIAKQGEKRLDSTFFLPEPCEWADRGARRCGKVAAAGAREPLATVDPLACQRHSSPRGLRQGRQMVLGASRAG